jgi:hypothetical protein
LVACAVSTALAVPGVASAAVSVTTLPPIVNGNQATFRGEIVSDCGMDMFGYFVLEEMNGGPRQDSMFDLGYPDQTVPGGSGQYSEGPFELKPDRDYVVTAHGYGPCGGAAGNRVFFHVGVGSGSPADVSITQSIEGSPQVGKASVLVVTATNKGKNPATEAFIKVLMPAGFAYNACEAMVGTVHIGFCWWDGKNMVVDNIGVLNSGATATLRVRVTPTAAGSFVNTVGVGAHEWDPDSANNFMDMPLTVAAR